jgi:ketosteroid isomerase-like protein
MPLLGQTTHPAATHVPKTTEPPILVAGAATQASLEQALQDWSQAWQQKNVSAYLAMYATDFEAPKRMSRQSWAALRSQRIRSKQRIQHEIRGLKFSLGNGLASVQFEQLYADERLQQTDIKTLYWVMQQGQWRISRETTH